VKCGPLELIDLGAEPYIIEMVVIPELKKPLIRRRAKPLAGSITEEAEAKMIDAAYLRRQAELCSALAELMSNPIDAQVARRAAEQYVQRAQSAEEKQGVSSSSNKASA
jgi:hypothetical protein